MLKKTFSYVKPFTLSILFLFALVIVQVECNLALPEAMANIVTNGIQFSGIQEEAPTILSKETHDLMNVFMDDSSKNAFDRTYTLSNDTYKLTGTYKQEFVEPFLYASFLQNDAILEKMHVTKQQAIAYVQKDPSKVISMMDDKIQGLDEKNRMIASKMAIKEEYIRLGIDIKPMQDAYLKHSGLIMLGITALGAVAAALISFISARIAAKASANLRKDVFSKVQNFEQEEFTSFSTASLITRTTNDVQQIQQVFSTIFRIGIFAPFLCVAALLKVIAYKDMTFILTTALLIIFVVLGSTFKYAIPRFQKIQGLVDRMNLVLRQQLSGLLVIRAFHNESLEQQRFDDVNSDITKIDRDVNHVINLVSPFMTFLMSMVGIAIIYFGGKAINAGTLDVGSMMAFMQYAMDVMFSFIAIAMIFTMIPRADISAKRIFEVLDTKDSVIKTNHPIDLPSENATLAFHHVSFKYPNAEQNVLSDCSFSIQPGQTVAIIGSTGCGKSTLVNLIPRFFDTTSGTITYGGIDIKDVDLSKLRKRISYIPQSGILFSGDVASNLQYANKDVSEEEMLKALQIAQADDFVFENKGFDMEIAQGGSNVSGGQRQRLSIARALSRNADIYIFDDTFSALDFKTDAKLRSALNEVIKEKQSTVFIVAQRISTIRNADVILVLENGTIVGQGKHEELLDTCKIYQEIAMSQLSKKEVAHE